MPTNSWGMLALTKLQDEQDGELDDVVDLLLTRDKAVLLLPVSTPSHPSTLIDREFIMDHVVLYKDKQQDSNQVITLSGIRGLFQKDQFIALGLFSSEKEISNLMTEGPKKSLFDSFSLDPASITPDHPKYNILASHVQLPLRDDKLITVMLIQRPLSKKEVTEWIETKSKNVKSIDSSQDTCSDKADEFIKLYKKNPPRNTEAASNKFLDFIEDLRDEGVEKDRLDVIETYICNQLYDELFTNPDGDEAMQDEALESRIAALNLLDLSLQHLGVLLQPHEIEKMNEIVKLAGSQLQQLNTIMGAKEKLNTLVKTHEIIVHAIEEFAKRNQTLDTDAEVVQEMKQAMSTVEEPELSELSSVNADILLPILIFTIVKSNPTNFLSNLKFIQRYRRAEELSGQASYCLTNMMASVSFLETTNLVGLGLSADRVYSHITDLNATKLIEPSKQSGLRIVSDVVDGSYKVFDGIGKFWQRNTQELENNKTVTGLVNRVRKVSDAAQPMIKEGLSELKEMTTKPSSIHSDSTTSSLPSFMEGRNNHRNVKTNSKTPVIDGPIMKFLETKSVEELTIGDVTVLLADYKRLSAIIKQAGLA
ncbi:hypothetical protein BD770DRAFT_381998 [Pilaira anomala]|nr:hypothetical protein BD770DRAFT_381998 [Pilaira anomala]